MVDVSKNGDRGITRSSLIFRRSKADRVKGQPLLREIHKLTLNYSVKVKLNKKFNRKRWSVIIER
jgi:hypothetical protein